MEINAMVLLVGIAVYGVVQMTSTIIMGRYLDRLMTICEKVSNTVIKIYENTFSE